MFSASTHIEIDKIFSKVKEFCIWDSTREKISPKNQFKDIKAIKDAVNIIEEFADAFKSYDFYFRSFKDVFKISKNLKMKNFSYSVEDIEGFNMLFLNLMNLINFISRIEKFQYITLYRNIISVDTIKNFSAKFGYMFDSEGKFDIDLHSEIKNINRKINNTRNVILKKISAFMNSNPNLFEDNYHRYMDERYVLPFKKINRREVVIHQISDSGNTYFAEPLWLIDMNNDLREYSIQREKIIKKIIFEITDWLSSYGDEVIFMCEIFLEIDEMQSKAVYKNVYNSEFPTICEEIELYGLKNPLISEKDVVALDILLPSNKNLCLITGPNAGGKTVLLKSLFYSILMTKCAIPLKCKEYSKIKIFDELYDVFGDESSILNYMSTFSSHIKKLSRVLKNAGSNTIIFIDEIISGTDPEEGAALAISILNALIEKNAKVFVSTHLNKIKDYFFTKPSTQCMSVRFDIEKMEPVFGVNYDSINSSYALEIAQKHGINQNIINKTREILGDKVLEKIDFIKELEKERHKYFELNDELLELKEFLYEKEREIKKREDEIEVKGHKKIQGQLEKLKREFDEYRRMAIEKLDTVKTKTDVAQIFEASAEISKKVKKLKENIKLIPLDNKDLFIGNFVYSDDVSTHGFIKDIKGNKITIQSGNFSVAVKRENLYKSFEKKSKEKKAKVFTNTLKSVKMEINVTGMGFEQAMMEVAKFIDSSYSSNINPVRVIHGRGIIRKECLILFKDDKRIASFEFADYFTGSDGVSVIFFKK